MNLYSSFAQVARQNSQHIALVDGETTYTYEQLLHAVEAMAAVAAATSDREAVGVFLPTSAAFVIASYGLFRAGFGVLPINLLVPPSDIAFAIQNSGIDTLITSRMFADRFAELPLKVLVMEDLAERAAAGEHPPLSVLENRVQPQDDDLANLLYTSGTTGTPKGVRLTHRNVLSNIEDCLTLFDINAGDTIIGILPLFHTLAFTATMGTAMHSGATYVTHARFRPDATLKSIEDNGVTILIAVPTMHKLLIRQQQVKPHDVSSLRLAVAGGEPLTKATADAFQAAFGTELIEGYGLTEASPVISFNPPGEAKLGTVGLPLPRVQVQILDENGTAVPQGEVGELAAHGPNIMQGYHNRPEDTAHAIRNGWLFTGDMAQLDEDGYITICGRKKEMIIVGGENVFPSEVEAVLDQHPLVEVVAVVGMSDEMRGEAVKAIVVPIDKSMFDNDTEPVEGSPGWDNLQQMESELIKHARELLPAYMVPREVEFRAEVPLGPTGKVLKRAL